MAKRRGRDVTIGAIFALALIILSLTVMAVGEESRFLSKKTNFVVVFPNTEGLTVGSPVKMAGVQVGTVTGVQLPTDPAAPGIVVQIGVDRAYAERVREDSKAALRIMLYLTGEKAVEIIPGTPSAPVLAAGSEIALGQDAELLEQVGVASQNLSDITVSLKSILGSLERGEGLIGQMLQDPDFGAEGLEALRGAFENMQRLTADMLKGRGFVGRLMYDEEIAGKLDDLGQAIEDLARLTSSIDPESGALGALLQKDGAAEQAIHDLRVAAASLRRTSEKLESDDNLIGKLLNDKEFADAVTGDLRTTLANTAEITTKVNSGQGTLGALVNERVLHDSMEDIVAGTNDSKFARWLLRRYQKKGIKSQSANPNQPSATGKTEENNDGD